MLWPTLPGMLAYGFMEAAPLCWPQPQQGGQPALKLSRRVVALGAAADDQQGDGGERHRRQQLIELRLAEDDRRRFGGRGRGGGWNRLPASGGLVLRVRTVPGS